MKIVSLSPIPIPRRERWQWLRIRVLPVVVFAAAFITVTVLWNNTIIGPTIAGEVERIQSIVASPATGTLTKVTVARFAMVEKGQPLAIVQPIDPRGSLDLMRSQLDNLRARLNPNEDEVAYDVHLQRFRTPSLQQETALKTAESNLKFAEAERTRGQTLLKKHVISPQEYDLLLKKTGALQTEVAQRKLSIAELNIATEKLRREDAVDDRSSWEQLLQEQEKKLRDLEGRVGPLTIFAPIDGMVDLVEHQAGENITAGIPILTIVSGRSNRIISYIREPFPFHPETGMRVTIRTRTFHRAVALSQISRVGTAFEPITSSLLRQTNRPEVGLPIEVEIPPELPLPPGGIVDLTFNRGPSTNQGSTKTKSRQLYVEKQKSG